jgi:Ca-activated chloride channel homolog
MRFKYTKYVPSPLDDLDMDDLLSKLSDLLLASGFSDPSFTGSEDDRSMQALHDAILEALMHGGVLPEETLEPLLGEGSPDEARERLEQLIQQIVERMQQEGYIAPAPDLAPEQQRRAQGPGGPGEAAPTRFEVTDKGLDFLGYRALRDLLGSVGRSSFGRHDTREMATGVETSGVAKPYEFGDTLNLDASATLLAAVERARRNGEWRSGARSRWTTTTSWSSRASTRAPAPPC